MPSVKPLTLSSTYEVQQILGRDSPQVCQDAQAFFISPSLSLLILVVFCQLGKGAVVSV